MLLPLKNRLLTQGWRPGRTFSESVGGILEMDSSDWSNGIRCQAFDTRPDTEFKNNGSTDVGSTMSLNRLIGDAVKCS